MLKKICSILMISTALAILLGHNFIGHHHHDKEQIAFDHSHAHDHHHENENNDDEENDFDFLHFLSHLPHDGDDIFFLNGQDCNKTSSKKLLPLVAFFQPSFTFKSSLEFVRQNSPPHKVVYSNSQYSLPSGLRAPPAFIV